VLVNPLRSDRRLRNSDRDARRPTRAPPYSFKPRGISDAAAKFGPRCSPWTASTGPLLGPPQHRFHSIRGRSPERVPKYRSEIMNRFWLPSGRSSATLKADQYET
jgi:hypothetical protein